MRLLSLNDRSSRFHNCLLILLLLRIIDSTEWNETVSLLVELSSAHCLLARSGWA